MLLSDNPCARALQRAAGYGVETVVVPRAEFKADPLKTIGLLRSKSIDFIVLAGFLSLVPVELVDAYRGRIINIHPALLPAYGGKGMYGDNVHKAVVANGEKESGITIHAVNELYDSGDIISQHKVAVDPSDTPATLAHKIHELEYEHFPKVIEEVVSKL